MSEFLYLDVLRISRRLILSFRSCFRIFSVASVRTVFYTVIFLPQPEVPFFPRVPAVDSSFFPAVSFPNRLPSRNFFEILRFSRGFLSDAPQFLPRLISCLARHFYRRLLCHSPTVFPLRRIYLSPSASPLNRLLHRNFSAPCPKFRFPRVPAVDSFFFCGFLSELSSSPQFFRNSPFSSWLFPAAPQFLPRLISCLARHFYRRLLCHFSTVFFAAPLHLSRLHL